MAILSSLKDNLIDLDLDRVWEGIEESEDGMPRAQLEELKQRTLRALTELICRAECVGNKNKLFNDLYNREKRATTAVGMGIAFPHIRTMQVTQFVAAIARSTRGIPFDAPDGKPVRLFFVMAAPPYDDKSYLRAYKTLATALRYDTVRQALLEAPGAHDIVSVLRTSI
ncbi:MAG: PTS sugar transporter subunit IIA [Candidatus Eisenbacteria sp.]|nr:PTS sugar transporter subunit IIA [Candidatus Eisenbacteria bacterium]